MKPLLRKYFEYTRAERLGISVLLLAGALILVSPTLLSFLFSKEKADFSTYQKDIIIFEKQQTNLSLTTDNELFAFDPNIVDKATLMELGLSAKVAKTFIKYRESFGGFKVKEELKKVYGLQEELYQKLLPYIEIEQTEKNTPSTKEIIAELPKTPIELFPFDPNTATEEELKKLGIPKKMISNLLNYRESGATFKQKEDVKRLYSFTEKEYKRLVDYITITKIETESSSPIASANEEFASKGVPSSYDAVIQPKIILDINKATAEEWQKLRGIGPTYANRIVKFREALGGFATVAQIGETYNFPDSTFQNIQLLLRPSPIFKKLKINELDAENLKAHPYISWKIANIIVNYRKQHGTFSSLEDLKEIRVLTTDWLAKIEPYLEF